MFPKKKSSRERSRLGLPSWRNTRSSLILSFSLSPLFHQPRVNFTPSLRLCLPTRLSVSFLFLAPRLRTCGKKAFCSTVSSHEYLTSPDYQQLPSLITLRYAHRAFISTSSRECRINYITRHFSRLFTTSRVLGKLNCF